MSDENENKETALKYAEQIAAAVRTKLSGYNVYVRLHEAAEYSYIELALSPLGGTPIEEKAVAHSQQYYADMTDPALKQQRAKRIFKDIQIMLGLLAEEANA